MYNFGVHASYVEDMLEEFNMSALESTPALRWDCRETDEVGLQANEQEVYRHLVGKQLRIGLADLRCAMGRLHRVLVDKATRT